MEVGKSPLVELRDTSNMGTFQHLFYSKKTVAIVEAKHKHQETFTLEEMEILFTRAIAKLEAIIANKDEIPEKRRISVFVEYQSLFYALSAYDPALKQWTDRLAWLFCELL